MEFPTLHSFFSRFGLFHREQKGMVWRLTDRVLGQITGIPTSYGLLTATNGVLCYIVRADGTLFQGHVAWFEPRKDSTPSVDKLIHEAKHKELPVKTSKHNHLLDEA